MAGHSTTSLREQLKQAESRGAVAAGSGSLQGLVFAGAPQGAERSKPGRAPVRSPFDIFQGSMLAGNRVGRKEFEEATRKLALTSRLNQDEASALLLRGQQQRDKRLRLKEAEALTKKGTGGGGPPGFERQQVRLNRNPFAF